MTRRGLFSLLPGAAALRHVPAPPRDYLREYVNRIDSIHFQRLYNRALSNLIDVQRARAAIELYPRPKIVGGPLGFPRWIRTRPSGLGSVVVPCPTCQPTLAKARMAGRADTPGAGRKAAQLVRTDAGEVASAKARAAPAVR